MNRPLILSLLLTLVCAGLSAQAYISVDPSAEEGALKPMNAVNNGPVESDKAAYEALHIPYARTHDTALGESYGRHCVDISLVFPNWNAPVNNPASYDFTVTDEVISAMVASGVEPFYRLGQSIEHQKRKYGIFPPKNDLKWAKICEHIIRHYTQGWAGGFHYDIKYWEIWNEPDLDADGRWKTDPRTWAGTQERFNKLYVVAAKHLKKCFPDLRIGGPAFANPRKYAPAFLDYVKEEGAPLDFLSWHMYHRKPLRVTEDINIVRKLLDEKGFTSTESILNEWNYVRSWEEPDKYSARVRPAMKAAAFVAAVFCEGQKAPLDMLMYYDFRPNTTWCGVFKPFVYDPQPPYYAFLYWAALAECGTQVASSCDTGNIYTLAAKAGDGRVRLLLSRYHEDDSARSARVGSVAVPQGYALTSCRVTDVEGIDRSVDCTAPDGRFDLPLASNAIALLEFIPVRN